MTKRALVIGACGGIGRGIATHLSRDGWKILTHGRRSDQRAITLDAVKSADSEGVAFEAELTTMERVTALTQWANKQGPLDVVIWSAGGGRSVSAGPDAISEWDRTFLHV